MAKSHKSCMEQAEIIDTFGTYHHHIPSPPNGPINGDANTSTLEQESSMNLETTKDKMSLDDITTTLINGSELDFDNCSLSEVIHFFAKNGQRPPH